MSHFAALASLRSGPLDPAVVASLRGRFHGAAAPQGSSDESVALHGWSMAGHNGSSCVALADARLENRDALIADVGGELRSITGSDDAALVLAAYEKYGDQFAERLSGDFAVAIWDPRSRAIVAARDVFGVRQLFFACTGPVAGVSSTIEALRAALPICDRPNRALLQAFLDSEFEHWTRETAILGIHRVPAGHVVVIRNEKAIVRRYHQWAPRPELRSRSDRDLAAEYAHLFTQSVRAKMDDGPTAVLLSGGLDSSAIGGVAYDQRRRAGAAADLAFIATRFPDTASADEGVFSDAMLNACPGATGISIPGERQWSFKELGGDDDYSEVEPDFGYVRTMGLSRLRVAAAAGCKVVLSGHWGDQLMTSRADQRSWLRRTVTRARRAARGLPAPPAAPEFAAPFAANCHWLLSSGQASAGLAHMSYGAEHIGVSWRFPYLDRALVEFMLNVPDRVRNQHGRPKWILRAGLDGVLPTLVRDRVTKSHISDISLRGPVREARRLKPLFEDSRVVSLGLRSPAELRRVWRNATDHPTVIHFRILARVVAVETWLRRRVEFAPNGQPAAVREVLT